MAQTVKVLIPKLVPTDLEIESIQFDIAYIKDMRCDGCGLDMGEKNPKGFFLCGGVWYKLCFNCCVTQGFIKPSNVS